MRAQDKMEELLTILFTIGVRPHIPLTPPSQLEPHVARIPEGSTLFRVQTPRLPT